MKHKRKKKSINDGAKKVFEGLGGAFVTAGAVAGASYGLSKLLMKYAMDRDAPKFMENGRGAINGSAKKSSKNSAGGENAADIRNKLIEDAAERLIEADHEEVEIHGFDGTRLAGHWFKCENPERVIVAMHGWRSSWARDFCGIGDFLKASGCMVLYADERGQGGSDGDYMSFGVMERHDCVSWAEWAMEKTEGKLPIYLMGVSMGASTVLMASALNLPENVAGIIADCGYTSLRDIWKHVTEKNLHLSYRFHEPAIKRIFYKKLHISEREGSAVDAVKESKVPVLFIHGSDDMFVPVEMTYENYKACTAPKSLLIVPGAGHAMSYFTEPEKYGNALAAFWKKCDNIPVLSEDKNNM